MDITKLINEAWLLEKKGNSYQASSIMKNLNHLSTTQIKEALDCFFSICIENQDSLEGQVFLDYLDSVIFEYTDDAQVILFEILSDKIRLLSNDLFTLRIMEIVGGFRNRHARDFMFLVYNEYKNTVAYDGLSTAFRDFLFIDLAWEANEDLKMEVETLWKKYKRTK